MTKMSPYDVAKLVIRDTIGVRYIKGKYKKGCNKGKRFTARITQTSERRIMDAVSRRNTGIYRSGVFVQIYHHSIFGSRL